jgi:CheY-like chemotaxis protein
MRRSTRTRSAPNDGARSVVGTASASATSKKRGANTVQYQQRAKTPEERIGKRRDDTSFSDEKKKKKTRTTATTKVIDDDSNEKKEEINDGIETTDLREKETKVGVEEEEGEDKDEKKSTEKKTKELEKEQEKKLRILLVEDDIPTSLIITSMLTQAGAVVTNASNGRQALERLRDNDYHEKIDLILTDIMMPEVDGIELCSILSKNPKLKEVPIIVMSVSDHLEATGEVLDENKALSIGAEGFLQKPLSKDVCRSVVGTHHRLLSNGSSSSSSLLLTTKKTNK